LPGNLDVLIPMAAQILPQVSAWTEPEVKQAVQFPRLTGHCRKMLVDRPQRAAPHRLVFPKSSGRGIQIVFAPHTRIGSAAINDAHDLAARVSSVLDHRPHVDTEQEIDWCIFNADGAVSQAAENDGKRTPRPLYDPARSLIKARLPAGLLT